MQPHDIRAPSPDELRAYSLGKLDAGRSGEVEAYLATGPDCSAILDSAVDDVVVTHLRGAGALPEPPPEFPLPARDGSPTAAHGRPSDAEEPVARAWEALADHARYRLLRPLGRGGMGVVFLAEHRVMRRPVALKVIRPEFLTDPRRVERFRREVQAAAHLSHPHIVRAYDAEEAHGSQFLVMEHVEGQSLDRWVAAHGPLPAAEACDYVRQAALGLQFAHDKGLVHRDIKPHNLMRTPDGTVKILDFGVARLAGGAGTQPSVLTSVGTIMGTADYMAPEQGQDSRITDARADVYSLGCTLYHLLTGRVPFPEGNFVDKAVRHALAPPEPLARLRPDLPAGLVPVVEKMMAKAPADRYQTAAQVVDALTPFAGLAPAPAGRPPARRRRLVAAALGLLGLGAALAGGAVYRIQTDRGELVITTERDDVEVVIKQGGRVVRVVDPKTNESVTLPSGLYDLELKGAPGLRLNVERATITRGGRVLARVERRAAAPGPAAKKVADLPAAVGLIARRPAPANAMNNVPRFSPDGRLLALTADFRPTDGMYRRVVETATGRLVTQVGHANEGITDLAFTPDGRRLLTFSQTTRGLFVLRSWDLSSDEVRTLRKVESPSGWPYALDLSRDGTRLAFSAENAARVVDLATGKVLLEALAPVPKGKELDGMHTRLSPDGRRAATVFWWRDRPGGNITGARFRVDDLTDGWSASTDVEGRAWEPSFTADGNEFAAVREGGGEDLTVDYWQFRPLRHARRVPLLRRAECHGWEARATPLVVVERKDHSVSLFDPHDGKEVYRTEPVTDLVSRSLSPDGRALALSDRTSYRLYRLPDRNRP